MKPKTKLTPIMANASAGETVSRWFDVQAKGTHTTEITIYDEIGSNGVTARQFAEEAKIKGVFSAKRVILRIHSGGGDVFEGFAIYNTLKGISGKLDIYIDGVAASIASVIACVPNGTVHMPENAFFYLHEAWGGVVGESSDVREFADFLDRNVDNLVKAYVQKTGLSEEKIRELMKKPGTWLDGNEAIELGFADVLIEPLQLAAGLSENRQKEFLNMPDKVKALISPHSQVTPQSNPSNQQRINAIKDIFNFVPGRFPEVLNECINDVNCTADMAKERLLNALGRGTTPINTAAHVYTDNGNIVGDSIKQALSARLGLDKADKDNPYKMSNLFDMAKASLSDRGVSISMMSNRPQVVGLAFTHSTSDFGSILLSVAEKSLLKGWEQAPETFELWTQKGQLGNFKPSERVGLNGFETLNEIPEGAEYKYITTDDHKTMPIALATYGGIFSISRQAIINDDLDVLSVIPQIMGRAAKRTIGDLVYAVLTKNAKMSDGVPLFHASHKNLLPGSLSVDSLSRGRKAMRTQEDKKGNTLNIPPAHLLVPAELETKGTTVLKSTSIEGATNSGIHNPMNGLLNLVTEPRLDKLDTNAYYLMANDQTIEVAYLDGVDTPYIEQQQGFTVDGVATKVRIDAGVAPTDHRAMLKFTGVDI